MAPSVFDWEEPNPQADQVCLGLPPGSSILDITESGQSFWTRTAQIRTTNTDDETVSYFLKVRYLNPLRMHHHILIIVRSLKAMLARE